MIINDCMECSENAAKWAVRPEPWRPKKLTGNCPDENGWFVVSLDRLTTNNEMEKI
jgi:hypothetical protein